jgi:hypothetical protein
MWRGWGCIYRQWGALCGQEKLVAVSLDVGRTGQMVSVGPGAVNADAVESAAGVGLCL